MELSHHVRDTSTPNKGDLVQSRDQFYREILQFNQPERIASMAADIAATARMRKKSKLTHAKRLQLYVTSTYTAYHNINQVCDFQILSQQFNIKCKTTKLGPITSVNVRKIKDFIDYYVSFLPLLPDIIIENANNIATELDESQEMEYTVTITAAGILDFLVKKIPCDYNTETLSKILCKPKPVLTLISKRLSAIYSIE